MKTVAYSEVPRTPGYLHLAYLSAASQKLINDAIFTKGIMMGAFSALVLLLGAKFKLNAKTPRIWRVAVITLVTVTLLVLIFALISVPGKTRGM